jgi:hypothetical protein
MLCRLHRKVKTFRSDLLTYLQRRLGWRDFFRTTDRRTHFANLPGLPETAPHLTSPQPGAGGPVRRPTLPSNQCNLHVFRISKQHNYYYRYYRSDIRNILYVLRVLLLLLLPDGDKATLLQAPCRYCNLIKI